MYLPPSTKSDLSKFRSIRCARNLGGYVQLEIHQGMTLIRVSITEDEAMTLCDSLRRVIESPTLAQPSGENVTVMTR